MSDLLDNPSRFSIPSILGILMSSLTGELLASNAAKKVQPYRTKAKISFRRFQRQMAHIDKSWSNQFDRAIKDGIHINRSLMIEKQVSMLKRLPGFNDVGVSLLARSLPCCTNPGELVKSLPNLANRLSSSMILILVGSYGLIVYLKKTAPHQIQVSSSRPS